MRVQYILTAYRMYLKLLFTISRLGFLDDDLYAECDLAGYRYVRTNFSEKWYAHDKCFQWRKYSES